MWWQRKLDFPCNSKHFRVHESCDVARFSRFFSHGSRGAATSLRLLSLLTLALTLAIFRRTGWNLISEDFPRAHVISLNRTRRSTCFFRRMKTEIEREKRRKIRSKMTSGGDFCSISPFLGWLGWVGRRLGGREKRTWSHPKPCAFHSNKWKFIATGCETFIDAAKPARGGCKNSWLRCWCGACLKSCGRRRKFFLLRRTKHDVLHSSLNFIAESFCRLKKKIISSQQASTSGRKEIHFTISVRSKLFVCWKSIVKCRLLKMSRIRYTSTAWRWTM